MATIYIVTKTRYEVYDWKDPTNTTKIQFYEIYGVYDTYEKCVYKLESIKDIKKDDPYTFSDNSDYPTEAEWYEYKIHKYEKNDNEFILVNKDNLK